MFILRRINSEGVELNTCLGDQYILVLKESNETEFEERTKLWTKEDKKDLYGVLCYEDGESLMPLYNKSTYYVMTSDGKTFSNISLRNY